MMNDPAQKQQRRALRKRMTATEKTLWLKLRSRRLKNKFRRQVSIGPFIVDFYCAEKRLIIELDGDVHAFAQRVLRDVERQKFLEQQGCSVLRFTNDDVRNSIDGVLDTIADTLERLA